MPTNFSVFRRAWKDTRVQLQCGQLLSTQPLVTGQRVVQPLCSALSTVLAKYVLAPLDVCSAMIQPGATCQRLDLQPCSQTYAVLGQYVITPAVVHSFWVLSVAMCQRPEIQPCSRAATVLVKYVLMPAVVQPVVTCQRFLPCSRATVVSCQRVGTLPCSQVKVRGRSPVPVSASLCQRLNASHCQNAKFRLRICLPAAVSAYFAFNRHCLRLLPCPICWGLPVPVLVSPCLLAHASLC